MKKKNMQIVRMGKFFILNSRKKRCHFIHYNKFLNSIEKKLLNFSYLQVADFHQYRLTYAKKVMKNRKI